jgi:hypothetical protein
MLDWPRSARISVLCFVSRQLLSNKSGGDPEWLVLCSMTEGGLMGRL